MVVATAPGKVLLAGEYAILAGYPAVVAAVDRRVRATVGGKRPGTSPFLEAVRATLAARLGPDAPEVRAASRISVESDALGRRGKKLGLGSSAAVTTAAVAAALGPNVPQAMIHALAHEAHGAAQAPRGARGSGADIVACVYGGVRRVHAIPPTPEAPHPPLAHAPLVWPKSLPLVLLWTGAPADTPTLVAAVKRFAAANPAAHAAAVAGLGAVAEGLSRVLAPGVTPDPARVIALVDDGARAIARLGADAGTALVPPGFDALAVEARALGGAAKPTGAGGGDLVLVVLPSPDAVPLLLAAARPLGLSPVGASIDLAGVRVAGQPDPA